MLEECVCPTAGVNSIVLGWLSGRQRFQRLHPVQLRMSQKPRYDKGEMCAGGEGKKIISVILNPSWNLSSILKQTHK